MSDYLYFLRSAFDVRIHAFVLMSNHFHLLAAFPRSNLSDAMEYFMRETSRGIARESDRLNHVYGSRVFRSRLSSDYAFQNVYKYVYQNPVQAGLCKKVEDYPYSTLHGLLGRARALVPVEEDRLLFDEGVGRTLSWLNESLTDEHHQALRKGLQKPDFKLPRDPRTGRHHVLETKRA